MARIVKICGMTRAEDVQAAVDADFLGFVVASPESPRNLDVETARTLMALTRPFQGRVAVTATTDESALWTIVDQLDPDGIQITHPFDPDVLAPIREVTGVYLAVTPADARARFNSHKFVVEAFLLDSMKEGYGGTGEQVDLEKARAIREASPKPLWLAGGLTPDNVADAIRAVDPDGVDVSTGVAAEDGVAKDHDKVARFVHEVWATDEPDVATPGGGEAG